MKKIDKKLFDVCKKGSIEEVEKLLNKSIFHRKVNVNIKMEGVGNTPLIIVAANGYKNIVKYLLDNGANINELNYNEESALIFAIKNDKVDVVSLLITEGADINLKNNDGDTTLCIAAQSGYKEIVELLISKGADVNVENIKGETPLLIAEEKGYKEITALLLNKGAKDDADIHIKRAVELIKNSTMSFGSSLIEVDFDVLENVKKEICKAIELEPTNPEYHYQYACWLQFGLQGEEAVQKLQFIKKKFPDYVQAEGHLLHKERWQLPFYYPEWNEKCSFSPNMIIPKEMGRCFVTPVRSGLRRIVSFIGWFPQNEFGSIDINLKADVRLAFMKTPYCPIVGAYALIDTHPIQPFTTETLLSVDGYPSNWDDCSRSGYWLIRMLAQQDFTYLILADPITNIAFYNKKIRFDEKTHSILTFVAEKIKYINQTEINDESQHLLAFQFFTNNFSLDKITF